MNLWKFEKKLGAKKAEKSLEISAFLFFSRSDLNRPLNMCHYYKIDPYKAIVQKQSIVFSRRIDLSLGDDGRKKFSEVFRAFVSCLQTDLCKIFLHIIGPCVKLKYGYSFVGNVMTSCFIVHGVHIIH